jgi:hypothetical protein
MARPFRLPRRVARGRLPLNRLSRTNVLYLRLCSDFGSNDVQYLSSQLSDISHWLASWSAKVVHRDARSEPLIAPSAVADHVCPVDGRGRLAAVGSADPRDCPGERMPGSAPYCVASSCGGPWTDRLGGREAYNANKGSHVRPWMCHGGLTKQRSSLLP